MKLLIFILSLLAAVRSSAQIEVKKEDPRFIIGTLKTVGILQAELSYQVIETDTMYTLLYRNQEYKQLIEYETVSFSGEDGTLEKLYNLFKSVFADENKKNKDYRVSVKLGNSDVSISNFKVMGSASAMFYARGYVIFSEKQIDKLFGKS